ncbi:MAG: hypothetical protein OSA95_12395 [Opitutales bacterium]|nr:hypothetical protein [Opitutales bacterium]
MWWHCFPGHGRGGFTGPINLHEEYINHRDPKLVPQHIEAIRKNVAMLKGWLNWS